jgi:hypothetical protein
VTLSATGSSTTQKFTWAHSDGIYAGGEFEKDREIDDDKSLAVLDLLTPTF